MKNVINKTYGAVAITIGLAFAFFLAAIKKIEEDYDDQYFWE